MSTKTSQAQGRSRSKFAYREKVTQTTIAGFRKTLHKVISSLGNEDQNMSIEQWLSQENGRFVLATMIDGAYISLHVDINEED